MITAKREEVIQRRLRAKDTFRRVFEDYAVKSGKSIREIAADLGIHVNTVRDTLSRDNKTLSADLVAAFCDKYKTVDLNYIYLGEIDGAEKNVAESNYSVTWNSADCHPLTDEAFMGTFYGYCRNTQSCDRLERFTLKITLTTKKTAQAELILQTRDQNRVPGEKVLYGTPMHLEPDMIYIVFQSRKGDDLFILSYNYFSINSGKKLYCRYGSMITACRSTDRYPQSQTFLFLDRPVPEEKLSFVDGFLNFTRDRILLPARLFEEKDGGLLATDANVKAFFHACTDLHYTPEPYYCFSEKVLLALGEANGVDFDTTASALMTLRRHSSNPKAVDFPNNKTYSKFFHGLTKE